MNALVVGGTGPTGPVVVEGLSKRGYQVTILHTGKHEVEFDVPVAHLHGNPHQLGSLRAILCGRSFDLVIGMYGRLRHLAEAIKGKTPRFVAVGGMPYQVFVDGDQAPGGVPVPVDETQPLFRDETRNKFTCRMTESEDVVMAAHAAGHCTATILRFPMIYGPRQVAPREWSIIRRILDGRRQLILPDGGLKLERRGYAVNAAHAILLAVDNPEASAGRIYNVGDETVWSLRNWVDAIAHAMNHQWEIVSMPFAAARPTRPYAGRAFHWVPDIQKIKQDLGYEDQVPPVQGLARTIRWSLENRPVSGGETEQALMDAFDYNGEDKLIAEYGEWITGMRARHATGFRFHHAYEHPKEK